MESSEIEFFFLLLTIVKYCNVLLYYQLLRRKDCQRNGR